MKYAVLKRERDEAIARAVEAERLSHKTALEEMQLLHSVEVGRLKTIIAEREAELGSLRRSVRHAANQLQEIAADETEAEATDEAAQ